MGTSTAQGINGLKGKVDYRLLLFGVCILVLDQLTKYLTYQFIPLMSQSAYFYPYGGIGIFENFLGIEFSISYTTNKGAAWGFFGNYQSFLILLRLALITGLIIYTFFFNKDRSWKIPLILILAGAIGNVIDFFVYGYVIDMLHFVLWGYDFPVFNVADSAISIGIAWLFILSFLDAK
jgi:signal peptidase II